MSVRAPTRLRARRSSELRCAFCHAALGEDDFSVSCACGSLLHEECWEVARKCPTLGCVSRKRIEVRVRPRSRASTWFARLGVSLALVFGPTSLFLVVQKHGAGLADERSAPEIFDSGKVYPREAHLGTRLPDGRITIEREPKGHEQAMARARARD